jgi:HEAT repeat protein
MWEAAKALARIGGPGIAGTFIKELRRPGPEERKIAAASALGQISGRKAVSALIRVVGTKRASSRLRGEAAEALGYISDRRAVPALLRASFDDSIEVRFWAAFALGQIGDDRAVPRLKQLVSSDHARLHRWGTISEEASLAIKQIKKRRLWKSA